MIVQEVLILFGGVCALLAVRATRLLNAALWLALASALIAILLYQLNAPLLAIIELSVGAGLVTVLLFLVVTVIGTANYPPLLAVPRWFALGLNAIAMALLIAAMGTAPIEAASASTSGLAGLWVSRAEDALVPFLLILVGSLAAITLLQETDSTNEVERSAGSDEIARSQAL
jgi:uncharacterized MnhB-related membrane protein